MAEQKTNAGDVLFRRIGGRIIPIRIKPNININIGAAQANQTIPNATTRTYTRGPYRTKDDKRNEQRRERYAIRKSLQQQQKEAAKWTADRGILGNKYLNPYAIGLSVAAGAGAVVAVATGVGAVKGLGPKLYGPGGFSGVTRKVNILTKFRGQAAQKAAQATADAAEALGKARAAGKAARDIWSHSEAGDLFKKAAILGKEATFRQQRTAELTRRLTAFKTKTGFRYTKPVVDFWSKNQARFYTGIGLATAGTTYVQNLPKDSKQ